MEKNFLVDTRIYDIWDIQTAIEDFQEVAPISFSSGSVTIQWEDISQIDEIFSEFMNYILSL